MFRRRAPEVRYSSVEQSAAPNIACVAGVLEQDACDLKGYLVVGVRHDNTVVIAHNAKSLPFVVGMLIRQIRKNPELAMTRSLLPLDYRR